MFRAITISTDKVISPNEIDKIAETFNNLGFKLTDIICPQECVDSTKEFAPYKFKKNNEIVHGGYVYGCLWGSIIVHGVTTTKNELY